MHYMVVPTTEGQTRLSAGGTGNEEERFQKQCPSECVRLLGRRSPARCSPPKLVWTSPFDLDLAWGPGKGHLLTGRDAALLSNGAISAYSHPASCSWFPLHHSSHLSRKNLGNRLFSSKIHYKMQIPS